MSGFCWILSAVLQSSLLCIDNLSFIIRNICLCFLMAAIHQKAAGIGKWKSLKMDGCNSCLKMMRINDFDFITEL